MIDCDDVCASAMNLTAFTKNIKRKDWDALSFNTRNYYDLWALSIYPLVNSLCAL